MTSLRACLLGLASCALAAGAFAVVTRDDTSDSLYRKLGSRAVFASVGRVDIDYGDGFQPIGSATLYGPDRVVCAAHVFDSESLLGAVGVRINFGRGKTAHIDFETPGVVNVHPRYDSATLRNDVSVVFLPPDFHINAADLYIGHGRRIQRNTKITFVGYGDTGTGLTGSDTFSIAKRGGRNTLGSYYMGGRDFEIDFDKPGDPSYSSLGKKTPVRLEGLIGPGDSGGSVWVRRGGKWRLIGINSYGLDWRYDGITDGYGDHSGFVYLPRYYGWMNSLVSPY